MHSTSPSSTLHSNSRRNYEQNDYYVAHLKPSAPPEQVASRLNLRYCGPLESLEDHHFFCGPKSPHDIVKGELRRRRLAKRQSDQDDVLDHVLMAQKQVRRIRLEKRVIPPPPDSHVAFRKAPPDAAVVKKQAEVMGELKIKDPIFSDQWHLLNTIQPHHDINVTGLWLQNITGHGVNVAIIDDGLDMKSKDLEANYFAEGSYDFNDAGENNEHVPDPKLDDDNHGTRCAGEVAAARNQYCGVGVAYDAKVAGLRILSKPISDEEESRAMTWEFHKNHIYSCSWGPRDDGKSMEAPGILIQKSIVNGTQNGRNGLGSIYVFASGNGAASGDNCNFDGYTNSIFSITVGAVDRTGRHPYYSELCSANLVVTYSSGGGDSIHTTDRGTNKCTTSHGGTSAAAPLAAGIFALVVQVRDDLTWRDMQYIAMDSAVPIEDQPQSWKTTAIGKRYSHFFGYGKIDSYALVEKAKTWKKVKPQAWYYSPWVHVKTPIPQGEQGLETHFTVTADHVKSANLERLEHVTVTINLAHTRRGDINVDLISPSNMVSHIATARPHDEHRGGYKSWTFMTVAHWGESGIGQWKLVVYDTMVNEHVGVLVDWHLKLWGEAADASKATPMPWPQATDDDDHDVELPPVEGPVPTHKPIPPPALPSDHPERPTKPTPGVPSFAKTGHMWLYGALILIIFFCMGLGAYLWMARRRRLRNQARDNYEFELINEAELEALDGAEKDGLGGRRSGRTRGGELYDAFAGGSDDDDDDGDESGGGAGGKKSGSAELGAYKDQPSRRLVSDDDAGHYVVGEESDDGGDDGNDEGEGKHGGKREDDEVSLLGRGNQ